MRKRDPALKQDPKEKSGVAGLGGAEAGNWHRGEVESETRVSCGHRTPAFRPRADGNGL